MLSGLRTSVLVSWLAAVVAAAGCHGGHGIGELVGTATDEWTRSYTLSEGGVLELTNGSGSVEVQGVEGRTVDIVARRTARATTDAGAAELLPRILIEEQVSPDRVEIETEGIEGMLIGADYEVHYKVKVPRDAGLRLRVVNGDATVSDLGGQVALTTTNGTLSADRLRGGVEARAVNGNVSISLDAIGGDLVDVRTTNGEVDLAVPQDAAITLLATTNNGEIDVSALTLEAVGEQTRRRVRGRMNGGGATVEASTVNGSLRVVTHP